ncbi:MAG: hypothetical protein KKA44_05085 [Alphaproteobacteria bacterium]|nr:hypothetical protein [Alphaproteobacteria bacterium]MBU1824335.1 hypothetical protein [Alphaproteobacteria bacterium]
MAFQFFETIWTGLQPHQEIGNRYEVDLAAVADKFEIDSVGIDQVRIGRLVPLALLDRIALQLDDILVDVLRLGPAERNPVALEQEIDHARVAALGFVDHRQRRVDALEQLVQGGAIAVFGRVAAFELRAHIVQISCNIHVFFCPDVPVLKRGTVALRTPQGKHLRAFAPLRETLFPLLRALRVSARKTAFLHYPAMPASRSGSLTRPNPLFPRAPNVAAARNLCDLSSPRRAGQPWRLFAHGWPLTPCFRGRCGDKFDNFRARPCRPVRSLLTARISPANAPA